MCTLWTLIATSALHMGSKCGQLLSSCLAHVLACKDHRTFSCRTPECLIWTENNEPMFVEPSFVVEILNILDPPVWITVPVMTVIDDSVGLVLCPCLVSAWHFALMHKCMQEIRTYLSVSRSFVKRSVDSSPHDWYNLTWPVITGPQHACFSLNFPDFPFRFS